MKKVERYEKLYDSLKAAHEALQKKCEDLSRQLTLLELQRRQWEADKAMQNSIIQQTIARTNATMNQILEENKALNQRLFEIRQSRIRTLRETCPDCHEGCTHGMEDDAIVKLAKT